MQRAGRNHPGAAVVARRDHAAQHLGALDGGIRPARGQHIVDAELAQIAICLDRIAGDVDGLVEGHGRALGEVDQQAQQPAVDGVLLGQRPDDEAEIDRRGQIGPGSADPLRPRELAHLQREGGDSTHVGRHGADLVGVEDEGPAARTDHDAQAQGRRRRSGGPMDSRYRATTLDLLGGGENGGLHRSDGRRRPTGGEVVAQLGPVRTCACRGSNALDILHTCLDDDMVGFPPRRR